MKADIIRSDKALFIIQNSKEMSLVHYKIDSEFAEFKMM